MCIRDRLRARQATRAVVTPSILAVVLRSLDAAGATLEERLPALRFWTVSGEATRATLVDDFLRHAPGATLVNVWGSTETAADACFHVLLGAGAAPRGRGDPAVGFPLTRAVRVSLDGGEVLVAGAAVALGYARGGAIVASPRFAGGAVRTGDRGAFCDATGALRILGRVDDVVNVRGVRVDARAVEAALGAGVVVVFVDGGDASRGALVAFAEPGAAPDLAAVAAAARPSEVVRLDALPRGSAGKVDRAALRRLAAVSYTHLTLPTKA